MESDFLFLINCILLGAGLAMDSFSVSLANGLNEPDMKAGKAAFTAGVFAFFQGIMPLAGWLLVHTVAVYFEKVQKFIPWISMVLLLFIGGKMLFEGMRAKDDAAKVPDICGPAILVQGLATSVDALSAGFTIAGYSLSAALACVSIIALVTFVICILGVAIGKKAGTRFSVRASVLGGIILIFVGIETFFSFS